MCALSQGAVFNDRACRAAARAAARGKSKVEARQLAQAALDTQQSGQKLWVNDIKLQGNDVIYNNYNGSQPPGKSPSVTVTTSTITHLPWAPLNFLKAHLGDTVTYTQSYTFPLLRL